MVCWLLAASVVRPVAGCSWLPSHSLMICSVHHFAAEVYEDLIKDEYYYLDLYNAYLDDEASDYYYLDDDGSEFLFSSFFPQLPSTALPGQDGAGAPTAVRQISAAADATTAAAASAAPSTHIGSFSTRKL